MHTHAELRELLDYEPETGHFRWRKRIGNRVAGSRAGATGRYGYIFIRVHRKRYSAHRLAWLLTTGNWPTKEIDHANGVRSDNRLANLREATTQQNQANAKRPSTNTSGVKGVHWDAAYKRWRAQIKASGKTYYLGSFANIAEAAAAYRAAARRHFGEFARAA